MRYLTNTPIALMLRMTPKHFNEAIKSQDVAFRKEAINDEINSIMGNNTWVLADLPSGCKPLSCKCIFKRKLKVDGTIENFKARLVIKGFRQKSGIDYFDTYALVTRISTKRLLIAMTSIYNLIIHQMDLKTTFLNGELDKEVYMNQPRGFIMSGNKNKYGGVFSQKGRGRGNGVKEKQSTTGDPTKVIVFVIDEPVVKEMQSSLVDTSILDVEKKSLRSYPPLPTQGSNPTGNTSGMSSYANVTCEPSRKALNFHTLFTPRGNGVDVVVPAESIRAISERNTWGKYGMVKSMLNLSTGLFSFQFSSVDGLNAMLENGPWFIRNHPLILNKWNPDEECLKNPGLGVTKNLRKPSQASRGVPVGPKVDFKRAKEYRSVSKKPTSNATDSYENGDYDEDPYDDDVYEGQDLPDKIQDICDNLDIRVRGRKKK
nr:zinc finger, CCHC-type [Tanacetum cinerariifolium]